MTDQRPPPQSTVQAAGRVAEQVVGGLSGQPMMLALIVLNVLGIVAALWFLHELMDISRGRMEKILKACMPNYAIEQFLMAEPPRPASPDKRAGPPH